ncbi:MAG: BatD family protein [Candidatus Neomarinimicrobiota bacterium]|jgi:hypothetical protein|nr:BatD family protein [Candidatus Neomarinimicrobiota bacterium]MDD3965530.1 BatD family protein [Candidatus Neomarinimicrobiota bacterium]MDX9780397.1 BatD family protein [bacterium]
MVKHRCFVKTVIFFLLLTPLLWSQHVTLTASKTQFSQNEEIRLTFTFENIKNAPRNINFDLHDDLQIVGGPYSSSNYSWVNGKMNSSSSLSYEVLAKRTGRIRIPGYEFDIKGEIFRTEPFTLQVGKSGISETSDSATALPSSFIKLQLPKDSMYQGETFTLSYYLYTSERVVNYTSAPLQSMEGFIVDRFKMHDLPASSKQILGGKEYIIAEIASLTLTATQTGEFIIPAKAFRISLKRQERFKSIFDDPFFGSSTNDVNLYSAPDTITVFPLPGGAGPHFTGAIGDFAMHISLDSSLIRENQASTLRIDLIGHGNMPHFTFPEQAFPANIEVFEPRVKNSYQLQDQDYRGQRTWEYVLIPSRAGHYRPEDVRFTYFSLRNKEYRTISMPVKEIRVLAHNELEGDYNSALTPEEVRLLAKDIRFIQMDEERCVSLSYNPVRDPRNRIPYVFVLIFLLAFVLMEHMFSLRERNMQRIRKKNALKNAMQHFRKVTVESRADLLLYGIEQGILNYMNDKQLSQNAHPGIADVMKTIETYKYAPGLLSRNQLEVLKDKVIAIIEEMEGV